MCWAFPLLSMSLIFLENRSRRFDLQLLITDDMSPQMAICPNKLVNLSLAMKVTRQTVDTPPVIKKSTQKLLVLRLLLSSVLLVSASESHFWDPINLSSNLFNSPFSDISKIASDMSGSIGDPFGNT